MKKRILGLLCALSMLVPYVAQAEEIQLLSSAVANCDPCFVGGDANAGIYDLSGFVKATVQVTSTAGSTAVFIWYCRNTASDPWGEVFRVTNPTATELPYVGPGACFCKGVVTGYVNGTLNGTLKRTK